MKTSTRLQENISAMVDGELPACDVELTMAAMADPDGHARWRIYQLIGEILRADAAAAEPGPDFASRLAARLAARLALEELPVRGQEGVKA